MGALIIFLIVLAAIAVLALVFVVGQYNALVVLRNRFKNAFSQIDVQLKRRHDLIPNLVETAKAYMQHESKTLEAVTQARNLAQSAGGRAAGRTFNVVTGLFKSAAPVPFIGLRSFEIYLICKSKTPPGTCAETRSSRTSPGARSTRLPSAGRTLLRSSR